VIDGAIFRLGRVSPALRAHLLWVRQRAQGEPTLRVVDALVTRGDVALDIGASFGMFSYRLAHLVGPAGHVHVFEPDPRQTTRLRALESSRSNVTFHGVALSADEGVADLRVPIIAGAPEHPMGSLEPRSRRPPSEKVTQVAVQRLDDALADEQREVAFIKCDVEGHERAVLAGAEVTLRRSTPTIVIEIEQRHQDGDIQETFAYLAELGYDGYVIRRDGLASLDDFDVERDQLSQLHGDLMTTDVGADYLNNFVFVSRERPPAAIEQLGAERALAFS
jgi:FkbM family methyltransferase